MTISNEGTKIKGTRLPETNWQGSSQRRQPGTADIRSIFAITNNNFW